jgi:Mg-chelatase subunit ChlD
MEAQMNDGRHGILHAGRQPAFICGENCPIRIIIIDRSFSMKNRDYRPTRLQAAIDAAIEYVMSLVKQKNRFKIAVISFGDDATVVVQLTDIIHHRKIIHQIESISINGSTDIGNALKQATELLMPYQGQRSQIVLLTDGCGDCKMTIPRKLKVNYNTTIDVVGIGGSPKHVNEDLLRKIATTDPDGTNHYRFIGDAKTLKQHYKQLATGLVWKGKSQ